MSDSVSDTEETQVRNTTRGRTWCFTWNNYRDIDIQYLVEKLSCERYLFGEEIGTSGTPHLQGVVHFKNARTFEQCRKIFKNNHIEKCDNFHASLKYCSKDGKTFSNIPGMTTRKEILLKKYEDVVWKDWQQSLIEEINTQPDDRTVIWVVDKNGNSGKSFLSKYLYLKYDAIIADGKKDNVFNQVKNWMDVHNNSESPKIIILDVPRHNADYINYGVLEQLKNGLIYSGKYEGGVCAFESPHVVIFSNDEPDYSKFTGDRWKIIDLE